jgi:hypothetical protein
VYTADDADVLMLLLPEDELDVLSRLRDVIIFYLSKKEL